jgi:FAD/FMN-containing dehydrogenase
MWDAKQQDYKSACRIEPTSPEEVASALDIIVENWCTFAVKSGGASRIRGSSNSVGGITIDLNRINTVEMLDNNQKARVGSGALWGDVYHLLEKHDVVVMGGRLSGLGVGGVTLGGGISYFAQKYGWATDNVLEYTVSISTRRIRKALFTYRRI